MAIGTRLRLLSEHLVEQSAQIYNDYNNNMKPKWFPVFFILCEESPLGITKIAQQIGQSHPSVSIVVKELLKEGLVFETKDPKDARKNLIDITDKGRLLSQELKQTFEDVAIVIETLNNAATNKLWRALDEFEYLLEQKSMRNRVAEVRKEREAENIKIIPYSIKYATDFKKLNQRWIEEYFVMEESDHRSLDNPQEYIINPGGYIIMALYNKKVVGTCALIKVDDPVYDFELAKMAVDPSVHGKGIGRIICKKMIDIARQRGAKRIFLESNTILIPAIKLYQQLGFTKMINRPSPYERSNIQMEFIIN